MSTIFYQAGNFSHKKAIIFMVWKNDEMSEKNIFNIRETESLYHIVEVISCPGKNNNLENNIAVSFLNNYQQMHKLVAYISKARIFLIVDLGDFFFRFRGRWGGGQRRENKSSAGMQHTTGYFQCKENNFETRPFHAKFEENR